MLHEKIHLDSADERVCLDTYISSNADGSLRDAMIVLPGGGYRSLSSREAESIALAYLARGYNSFVLSYRVGLEGDVYPKQLIDISRAILHVRENAEKYGIKPDRVFVVGFSAGGHLAGASALMSDDEAVLSELGVTQGKNKPNAVILAYPVVTAMSPTHEGSFTALTGKAFANIPEDEKRLHSLELHVDENSPPAFIWHTAEDKAVPPYGSFHLAEKYVEYGRRVMFTLYPYGAHGLALANKITSKTPEQNDPLVEVWVDNSVKWLETI